MQNNYRHTQESSLTNNNKREIPERPPTCSGSYQWLCKMGMRSRFRIRSQPVATSYLLFLQLFAGGL